MASPFKWYFSIQLYEIIPGYSFTCVAVAADVVSVCPFCLHVYSHFVSLGESEAVAELGR